MARTLKSAFVIMPIKSIGSPEHKHYRALFDSVISPTISAFGYEVKRADDFQSSGSITKDIIFPLATADLVVADLTGLNPNVFYELGVRHALMGRGTIMIMDESQTDIPFDINSYRVIKFRSDVAGIGELRNELSTYARQFEQGSLAHRDNLVHDWIPKLPNNVYEFVTTGRDDDHAQTIARLQQQLNEYVDRFGQLRDSAPRASPKLTIRAALEEAKAGDLPEQIIEKAEAAARNQDVVGFLEHTNKALNLRSLIPSARMFYRLRIAAANLELQGVEVAIVDQAYALFPEDQEVITSRLAAYAHSEDSSLLGEAIAGFKKFLGIVSEEPLKFSRRLKETELIYIGTMLDALHQLQQHDAALKFVRAANEVFPDRAVILRNLARALEKTGNTDESLEYYRQAARATDSDDQGPGWLGTELNNRDRFVDASEAYSLAAIRDPNDPVYFARMARTIAYAIRDLDSPTKRDSRSLPEKLASIDIVIQAMSAALCCQVTQTALQSLRLAAQQAELDLEELASDETNPHLMALKARSARLAFAREVYQTLMSPLTTSQSPPTASTA